MDENNAVIQDKEADTEELSMEELLEQGELSLDMPSQGDVREGIIASISSDEVLVSIGAKSEGVIPTREIAQLTEEEREKLQVGDTVTVYVISPESRQGTLILSLTRALEEDDWNQAEELLKTKEAFSGVVDGYNKGGLIVNMGHLRGFVPASQISMSRRMAYSGDSPDQRWSNMVGEPMVVRVIEVDRERRRLIMSEKAASQESRESLKERLLVELEEGTVRTGRVTSLADFGAFVNINGADGLVHLSEISWERIDHPSEVLEVGQEIDVKVISIDKERRRIGLSIRRLQNDPWEDYVKAYQVGQLVEGTVTRLTKFGGFARIDDNLEGLIHVSEISDKRIEHPKEVISEGDVITLRVIKIDIERRRIGLSLRKVESMQYSELDWEMALADEDEVDSSAAEEGTEAEAVEDAAAEESTEVEAVEDTAAEEDTEMEAVEDTAAEESTEVEAAEDTAVEDAPTEEATPEEEEAEEALDEAEADAPDPEPEEAPEPDAAETEEEPSEDTTESEE